MTQSTSQIKDVLSEIFTKQFGADEFAWDKKQDQYERWDSLTHMELVGKVEEAFNIKLSIDEVVSLTDPDDFLKVIASKAGQ